MREIADGVFAYVQMDGGWCVNNSGLITAGDQAVLIDTAATERRALALRDAVTRIVPGGPTMLVNTHHHGDHTFGNAQFHAPIIAHEQMRTEMLVAGLGLRDLWPDVDWGSTPLIPPHITFRDAITLHLGEVEAELIHVGPAHTTNDVVIWLPFQRVLFAGDVLMSGVTPFLLMGSLPGSLAAIARLRALDPEVIVPGHGAVGGRSLLDDNEEYLRWLHEVTEAGIAAGLSPLEAARSADVSRFKGLLDPERIVGNLHRAYADRQYASVDLLAGFREMVVYNGGLPTCHA